MEFFLVQLLNGVSYGLLLFMLSSGLTLVFSLMGVLNFAHASFYMLGAYFAYQISTQIGFFPALVAAPLLVGGVGMLVERFGLRHRAREPVEDKPGSGIRLLKAFIYNLQHDLVRNERPPIHVTTRLYPQRRTVAYNRPQEVTACNLRRLQLRFEQSRLGTFAGTGRPEQHQPHAYPPLFDLTRPRRIKPS